MGSEDRSFNDNLDLLIKLFKRLKDKASFDDMPGIDKTFYQNFEYLLGNYENMRDQLSEELLSKFGEPVKGMIASLVEQLKTELGDDIGDLELDETEEKEILVPDDIAKIDEMLKPEYDGSCTKPYWERRSVPQPGTFLRLLQHSSKAVFRKAPFCQLRQPRSKFLCADYWAHRYQRQRCRRGQPTCASRFRSIHIPSYRRTFSPFLHRGHRVL